MRRDKKKVLKALQDLGAAQLEAVDFEKSEASWGASNETDSELSLLLANLEFVVELLAPFAKKRGMLEGPVVVSEKKAKAVTESFDYAELINICKDLEVKYTNARTTLELLEQARTELAPWKNSKVAPKEALASNGYEVSFVVLNSKGVERIKKGLAEIGPLTAFEIVHSSKTAEYATLIYSKDYTRCVKELLGKMKVKEVALPEVQTTVKDALKNIAEQKKDATKIIKEIASEFKKLAANYETIQIIHDYFKWQVDLTEVSASSAESETTFAYSGWLPLEKMTEIENELRDKTNNKIAIVPIDTDEQSPVALKNHALLQPIENVTTLYGLPIPNEYDPTTFISIFFVAFFGMAVTDAGYGIVMTIAMLLVLKYMKLSKQIKSFVKLLLYAGILTAIMGFIYGGWFGMTVEQAPNFLTTGVGDDARFIGQVFNPIEDPMSVLILSLVVGYIQISFGVFISFWAEFTKGSKATAMMDHFTWFITLVSLAAVIMGQSGVVNSNISEIGLWLFYLALASLVCTQGRDKKGFFGKAISGVLSLYGLVGYFGDILSYSRLLALGLATAIIGLAVNVVAGLVGGLPVIGWLLVIIVLIGGHLFNLVVNALGAFIHSARLQFVEFFSKFLTGGGKPFRPFRKQSKYIMLEEDM